MNKLVSAARNAFKFHFGKEPVLVKSPGRVNLIGEHTDYNDGFVLPAAIDKIIAVGMAPNGLDQIRFYSIDMEERFSSVLGDIGKKSEKGWPNYILGVMNELQKAGYNFQGFDCVFGGDIPIGAGLSSSAALEGGIIAGLSKIFDLGISKHDMALLAQKAENNFVGVQCGIMDQFVNIHGHNGNVLKLDCRSLDYELYPFDRDDIHIVLCDTKIRRELATSEYNIRRRQCEEGVKQLQKYDQSVKSLRDVDIDLLQKYKAEFDPVIYNRSKYVVEENQRVLDACDDLLHNDLTSFGKRMYESHAGLRDLYEVSCRELDILVEEAQTLDGVIGSRMMGGGFGGCTINLVEEASLKTFTESIKVHYESRMSATISVYLTQIGAGVRLEETEMKKN